MTQPLAPLSFERFAALLTVCARRDLRFEAVPMLLGLEALEKSATFTADAAGTKLAAAAETLFAQFLAHHPNPTILELRLFVETLAQGLFSPTLEPAPAPLPADAPLPPPPEEEPTPLLLPKPFEASFAELLTNFRRGSYLRVVNFHNTPRTSAAYYDSLLRWYAEHFSSATEADLTRFFATGRWHKEKPPLLLCFFEGTRNHYDVILPLLKRYGFTGWFFIIPHFLEVPPAEQVAYADAHYIGVVPGEYGDERLSLSWGEVRDLSRNHVIVSHTLTHTELTPDSPDELMVREIGESKHVLEAQLGREVESFAWLLGAEYGLNSRADAYLLSAGYKYLFSTFKLQKLRS